MKRQPGTTALPLLILSVTGLSISDILIRTLIPARFSTCIPKPGSAEAVELPSYLLMVRVGSPFLTWWNLCAAAAIVVLHFTGVDFAPCRRYPQ